MRSLSFLSVIVFFLSPVYLIAQKGCTDPQASNYNPGAKENDGSCIYPLTYSLPVNVCPKLNDTLLESSGLIYWNKMFFTINDSDNPPYLYSFDSITGNIIHKTFISNALNIDWEELTQDANYIYIADFGNNLGNRKDLRILKIKKTDIDFKTNIDTVKADFIRFSMADQTNFNNPSQNHNYDMEAFCIYADSLHLFSKNWADNKSRHYVISKDTGTFSVSPIETLEVNGQITGAAYDELSGRIVLTGYSKTEFKCYIWIYRDFKHGRLLSGHKRRIELGTAASLGQNEGICFREGVLYLSTEKYLTNASLKRIDILPFSTNSTGINTLNAVPAQIKAYQKENLLHITVDAMNIGKMIFLYTHDGRLIKFIKIEKENMIMDISEVMDGIYILKLNDTSVKIQLRN